MRNKSDKDVEREREIKTARKRKEIWRKYIEHIFNIFINFICDLLNEKRSRYRLKKNSHVHGFYICRGCRVV